LGQEIREPGEGGREGRRKGEEVSVRLQRRGRREEEVEGGKEGGRGGGLAYRMFKLDIVCSASPASAMKVTSDRW
jgi:hypothetical protein